MTASVDNPARPATLAGLRDRFGAAGGVGRLSGFLQWWSRALASWLPLRMRTLFGLTQRRLLLRRQDAQVDLVLETDGALRDLGSVPLLPDPGVDPLDTVLAKAVVDTPRWLLLPPAAGLLRRLVLPATAADRLRDVLAFELERQTPFAASEVYFDARVAGRRPDGQIDVDLVVAPSSSVEAAVAGLGPASGSLVGVDLAATDGRPLQVNLLPVERRRRAQDPSRGWNAALAVIAVIALAAGLWQILSNRRASAEALAKVVAQRSGQARSAALQERQLIDTVQGLAFLQRTRSGRPTTVEVLDELTRKLPDNTYLEKLSIENDQVLLIGLSDEASALPQRLEGSALWKAPALTGALQPDQRSGKDRFTLTAQLAVAAPAKEDARARRSR